jgi:tetratricopeptide (TPR) repeat protein
VTIREARLAFLDGDSAAALALSEQAADEADARGDSPAGIAFFNYAVGEYAFLAGDLDAADAAYGAALESLPGYALATAGQGRVAFARGDLAEATAQLEASVAAVPRPDHVAYLGDLYALAGRSAEAEEQYATVDFMHELAAQDGAQVYDREYSTFLADHGRDATRAVDLARAELFARRDVYGYDTLAWALHAAGLDAEALLATREALALGTADARLLIHAGLIELANGLDTEGRAHLEQGLALQPAFSPLVVQQAREALAQ